MLVALLFFAVSYFSTNKLGLGEPAGDGSRAAMKQPHIRCLSLAESWSLQRKPEKATPCCWFDRASTDSAAN